MKFLNKKLIGFVISIVFIALIIKNVDMKETLRAFNSINLWLLLFVIPAYYSSFMFRALRWRIILSSKVHIEMKSLLSALFIGFTANCFLPARMGDIYRAHIFGRKLGLSRTRVFASIVIERIFDGMILSFILISFLLLFYTKPWLYKLAMAAGIVFAGGFLFLLFLARHSEKFEEIALKVIEIFPGLLSEKLKNSLHNVINKIGYLIRSFTDGLDILNSFSLIAKAFFLSFAVWFFEGMSMFFVIKSFGIPITPITCFFVLGVTTLSTMIPSGPASVGPYQFGYILALGLLGITKGTALAVSFVNQFTVILLISVVGIFCMFKDHINLKELEEAKTPIKNA